MTEFEERRVVEREALHRIDTRLTLVEERMEQISSAGKWLRGIAVFLVLNIIFGVTAFVRLSEQVSGLNLTAMETNITTALSVLGQHGVELQEIRNEQARIRGVTDTMRHEILERTAWRFTTQDAARLEQRITRLEDIMLEQKGVEQ